MRGLALLPVLLCVVASAQNWALLNPAYKYNYSNDGSDTISNQIFVTHIDTLGVDSFRYELNAVAELADTSTAYDLFLRTDVPQFLQRTVDVGPGIWHFHDPGSFVVISGAEVGASWLFDTLADVTATVTSMDTLDQFGSSVARKTIALSNGGSITISGSYGVLSWGQQQLLGVHGPDVGLLIPSIHEFYGLQPGDIACYDRSYGVVWGGSTIMSESYGKFTKRTISSRVQSAEHVELGFTGVSCISWSIDAVEDIYDDWGHECGSGTGTWTLPGVEYGFGDDDPFEVFPFHELIRSYPGQAILDTSFLETWAIPMLVVAEHYLDAEGRYVIRARKFRDPDGAFYGWFAHPTNEVEPGLFELTHDEQSEMNGVIYRERVGLVGYWGYWFESSEVIELTGAVINGDTTGTVTSDSALLGVSENLDAHGVLLYPNPTNERLSVRSVSPSGFTWRIFSMTGVLVLTGRSERMGNSTFDVSSLPVGPYVIEIVPSTSVVRERFIIAR